eukprot:285530-Amphidinium_carterae.2
MQAGDPCQDALHRYLSFVFDALSLFTKKMSKSPSCFRADCAASMCLTLLRHVSTGVGRYTPNMAEHGRNIRGTAHITSGEIQGVVK